MPLHSLFGTVIRINPDNTKTRFEVSDHKTAEYLHGLQEHGFKYMVVHDNESRECEACSS